MSECDKLLIHTFLNCNFIACKLLEWKNILSYFLHWNNSKNNNINNSNRYFLVGIGIASLLLWGALGVRFSEKKERQETIFGKVNDCFQTYSPTRGFLAERAQARRGFHMTYSTSFRCSTMTGSFLFPASGLFTPTRTGLPWTWPGTSRRLLRQDTRNSMACEVALCNLFAVNHVTLYICHAEMDYAVALLHGWALLVFLKFFR